MFLTENIARLSDRSGFIAAFNEELEKGAHKTRTATYEALERMRIQHLGGRKFKNYDSFRVSRAAYKKKAAFFLPVF